MNLKPGYEHAAWTWTCSMDMDMQHGNAAWACSIYKDNDMNTDMDTDMDVEMDLDMDLHYSIIGQAKNVAFIR
jgi:hypothetical protein